MDDVIFYNQKLGTLHATELIQEEGSDQITALGTNSNGRHVKWTFPLRNVEEVGNVYFIDGKIAVKNATII